MRIFRIFRCDRCTFRGMFSSVTKQFTNDYPFQVHRVLGRGLTTERNILNTYGSMGDTRVCLSDTRSDGPLELGN